MDKKQKKTEESPPVVGKQFKIPEEALKTGDGKPHRCSKCNRLLFKGEIGPGGIVEVKCGKCGTVNEFTIDVNNPLNFQDKIYINRRYRHSH